MKDLTLQELRWLINWGMAQHAAEGLKDEEKAFFKDIKQKYEERVELESTNFNDCLGGGCTL